MDPADPISETPDSWEQGLNSGGDTADLASAISQLNVNATPFVPNVHAPAFVPSFLKDSQTGQGKEPPKPFSI